MAKCRVNSVRFGGRQSAFVGRHGDVSQPLFESRRRLSAELGKPVPTAFSAPDMQVSLVNDGPVTIVVDSRQAE